LFVDSARGDRQIQRLQCEPLWRAFHRSINQFDATLVLPLHRTIDGVVDGPYTTSQLDVVPGSKEIVVAFVRRKGNTYFLVHNVRRQGKVQQLQLARLGERPRITDEVVRAVSRNHPFLELDWSNLRERVNSRVELFNIRSLYVQNLMHSLRNLNLDLADLSPPMLVLTDRADSSRELVTQLRLLRSTVDIKLDQFERAEPRDQESGRRFR
jgi:hypothetical protein